jgi:hypothetical protein
MPWSPHDLYARAEHERTRGSTQDAIQLLRMAEAHPDLPDSDPLRIDIRHMLGVCLRVVRQHDHAETILRELLSRDELPQLRRGQVMRDCALAVAHANVRDPGRLRVAEELAFGSYELLCRIEADADNRAASLGFGGRILFRRDYQHVGLAVGEQAKDIFADGEDSRPFLYHMVWMATGYTLIGHSATAKAYATNWLEAAQIHGKPVHVNRLKAVLAMADQLEEFKDWLSAEPPE